ncbi:hypothetical protein [Kitasatospora indigofera]|uniref:hypothetical protein n=1 Tax=Kitasatospora indigofera TaxID=67307 RepID=UPI0036BAA209
MRWLAGLHADPASCLEAWISARLVPVPIRAFAVIRVSAGLGLQALDILGCSRRPGPVLYSVHRGTAEFLVTAQPVDLPGTLGELLKEGVLECPAPGRSTQLADGLPPTRGPAQEPSARWVVAPDGSGFLWPAAEVVKAMGYAYSAAARTPDSENQPPRSARLSSLAPFFAATRTARP